MWKAWPLKASATIHTEGLQFSAFIEILFGGRESPINVVFQVCIIVHGVTTVSMYTCVFIENIDIIMITVSMNITSYITCVVIIDRNMVGST